MAVGSTVGQGIVAHRELLQRLAEAGRVVTVTAPPGSGKTVLLRSWIDDAGLAGRTAWVTVHDEQRDPQGFWISVANALRGTRAGSKLIKPLTAAPNLDGWTVVERLLADLGELQEPVWLVLDDLHELHADEVLRQLELFLLRAPATLRFALAARHDMRLGLHRLRLEGRLTEIRAVDLRLSVDEARSLFDASGVKLSGAAVETLVERTEGWAAGLRLAALSLREHADPERFASEFSGTERTVSEYLLTEVLDRQPAEVRRLLLRTSILERVSGPLADRLTGDSTGERILQSLEEANAFVFSVDAARTWFRYHRLFGALLQLELRRSEPDEVRVLHAAAAEWLDEHGHPVEAIRHAQAAERWDVAVHLLFDHWDSLRLDGKEATVEELLSRFPPAVPGADAELSAMRGLAAFARGSLETVQASVAHAMRCLPTVPADRRPRFEAGLALLRLFLARRQGNLPAIGEAADRLVEAANALDVSHLRLGEDMRAIALLSAGVAENWSNRIAEADRDLEQAVTLARRINRPFLEINALGQWALLVRLRSFQLAQERSRQAIELVERHGWIDVSVGFAAYVTLGNTLVWQGRLEEGSKWLERAMRQTANRSLDPPSVMMLNIARAWLALLRGRDDEALALFRSASEIADGIVTPHTIAIQGRAFVLGSLVRMGKTEAVAKSLAGLPKEERELGDMKVILGMLRLAQGDPEGAMAALASVIDGSASVTWPVWLMEAFVLDSIARDSLGDAEGAAQSLERGLELAEPYGAMLPFLLHPSPRLFERHARRRTSHAALLAQILDALSGKARGTGGENDRMPEPLSESERRILRYLPTNLSVPEIAQQTYLSANTIKTHMRHLYDKLGAHSRREAVERARGFGLLAPAGVR